MRTETYLIFVRKEFEITKETKFYHKLETIRKNDDSFFNLIQKYVEISEIDKSYINIYRLKIKNKMTELYKIAWIKEGNLYTL